MSKPLRDQLIALGTRFPKRSKYGQLYASESDTKGKIPRVIRYIYMRSDERTYCIHETVFKKKNFTAEMWAAWFRKNGKRITDNVIIDAMERNTGMFWTQVKIIGWASYGMGIIASAAMGRRRNKTKSQGITHGQTNIRGR